MANHKSALKRHRQNIKRRAQNRAQRSEIRTTIKAALLAAKQGNKEDAQAKAKIAASLLGKASVKGLHSKNNAARRVSRLSKQLNSLNA